MPLFNPLLRAPRMVACLVLLMVIVGSPPAAAQLSDQQDQLFPNCDHPDFPALISFYASTNGPNWLNNDGWAEGAAGEDCAPCDWWGIDCDANGRVIVIKLPDNRLTENLPANLGDLSSLIALVVPENGLSGQLPFSIENLTQLRILDVSKNKLSGYIPPEIGEPALLKILLLDNNDITGVIPQELASLSELQVLHLNDNNLSCVYDESVSSNGAPR